MNISQELRGFFNTNSEDERETLFEQFFNAHRKEYLGELFCNATVCLDAGIFPCLNFF